MTRQDFINDVVDWCDLIHFCFEEELDCCENVYESDAYDERIEDEIQDMLNEGETWRNICDCLSDLPTGYGYYIYDGGDWYGADDEDFDNIKREVIDVMDYRDDWDDEEELLEELNDNDPEDDVPLEEEDIPIAQLFTTCNDTAKNFEAELKQSREREALLETELDALQTTAFQDFYKEYIRKKETNFLTF